MIMPERIKTPSTCWLATVSLTPSKPTPQPQHEIAPATPRRQRIRNQVEEVCGDSTINGQDGIRDSEYFARLPASGVPGLRPSGRSNLKQRAASTPYIHSRQSAALVVATLEYLGVQYSAEPCIGRAHQATERAAIGVRRRNGQCTWRRSNQCLAWSAINNDAGNGCRSLGAEILRQQGCIWLAVRPGLDYSFRRAASKLKDEIHLIEG